MGMLDEWSRRATQRRDGKLEFLGEQSGLVEDTLKRELLLELVTRPDIQRAYLAGVSPRTPGETSDALCIVSTRPDDRSFVLRVGEILRRRFGKEPELELVFLTAAEEAELSRVCTPFYRRAF